MWDVYALGVLLSDLVCNPTTAMETMRIDDSIKASPPRLPKNYDLEGKVESELLLALVSHEPEARPSMEEIKNDWLPRWH